MLHLGHALLHCAPIDGLQHDLNLESDKWYQSDINSLNCHQYVGNGQGSAARDGEDGAETSARDDPFEISSEQDKRRILADKEKPKAIVQKKQWCGDCC